MLHLSKAISHHTDAVKMRKSYPHQIPVVSEYLATSTAHRHIVAFNNSQNLPKYLIPLQSELESTLHEKNASIVKWLMENKTLNPTTLAHFYARPENLSILECVLDIIYYIHADNFVEFLRSYMITTGCLSLVGDETAPPAVTFHNEGTQNQPQAVATDPTTNQSLLNYHLSIFSKYYISHDDACRHSTHTDPDTWEQIRELSHCILTLSEAISKSNNQDIGTLPDFFSVVRTFAKRNYAMFAPRNLTSMFNTLKANGSFALPKLPSGTPPFLFSNHFHTTRISFTFNDANDAFATRKVVLTRNAMYTFADVDAQEGNEPPPASRGVGKCIECVPLQYVKVQDSEMEYLSIELHSHGEDLSIPCFQIGEEGEEEGESLALAHYSCMFIKTRSHADHDALLAQLECCIWEISKRNRSLSLL
jgi:hypothetical protein